MTDYHFWMIYYLSYGTNIISERVWMGGSFTRSKNNSDDWQRCTTLQVEQYCTQPMRLNTHILFHFQRDKKMFSKHPEACNVSGLYIVHKCQIYDKYSLLQSLFISGLLSELIAAFYQTHLSGWHMLWFLALWNSTACPTSSLSNALEQDSWLVHFLPHCFGIFISGSQFTKLEKK